MNIRCSFCQTPLSLSRIQMIDALQEMDSKKLTHYDVHCPRCRRANPIQKQRLEMFLPNWRDALKELEVEMKENPQQAAPLPTPETDSAAETESKPEPAVAKKGASKPKPEAVPAEEAKAKRASRQTTPSAETKKTATKGKTKKSK